MTSSRNTTIDFLRGFAVILMIFVHATAYFLSDPFVYILWDYTHIVVPLFVFCSAYIFFQKKEIITISVSYIMKRLKRLLTPYYLYLIPLFVLVYINNPSDLSINNVISNLTWGTGRDVGWLVVLFIYLIFLIPVLHFMYIKHAWLFRIFAASAFVITVLLVVTPSPLPFRFIMWLPWSFFLVYTIIFAKYGHNKMLGITILILSAGAFVITRDVREAIGGSLVLTENKYPPNLNYLSYGIFFSTALYYAHSFFASKDLYPSLVQKGFDFLSYNSYSLFFIHFLYVRLVVNEGLHKTWGWWWFFVIVTALSVVTQIVLNTAANKLTSVRH